MPKKTTQTTIDCPQETRMALISPNSVNDGERTVDVVFSTGARMLRRRFFSDDFEEELIINDDSIRLDRLNSGAPILDSHNNYELGDTLGVVERGWLENGHAMATLKFHGDDEVKTTWARIKAGTLRNISVGYAIHHREIIEREHEPDLHRIVDWEPMEISIVPIPADMGAQTRSQDRTFPCEIINRAKAQTQETDMPKKSKSAGDEPVVAEETRNEPVLETVEPVDADAIRESAIKTERQRGTDIRDAVRDFGFAASDADAFIKGDQNIDEVRAVLQKKLAEKNKNDTPSPSGVRVGQQDSRETHVELMTNALQHRVDPGGVKLLEGARQFRGMGLIDMARDSLESLGVNVRGMTKMEIAESALSRGENNFATRAGLHSTSDFPIILANTVNRTLRAAYDKAPKTYQRIARRSSASDFRPLIRAQIGDNPRMLKLNENGEFERGTIGEDAEQYSLETFGRIIGFTRQTLINDDLSALDRIPRAWGIAASALENEIAWGLITGNANMSDGFALFSTEHNNKVTASAISVTSVGVARDKMRQQTSLKPGGKKDEKGYLLRIEADTLVVPSALETVALQFLSTIVVPTKDGDINPYKTTLQPLVEPLLDATSASVWYLMGSPGSTGADTIEYSYLDGQDGVYTDSRMGFDVDGVEFKARLDFGAGVIDYRAMFRNG